MPTAASAAVPPASSSAMPAAAVAGEWAATPTPPDNEVVGRASGAVIVGEANPPCPHAPIGW